MCFKLHSECPGPQVPRLYRSGLTPFAKLPPVQVFLWLTEALSPPRMHNASACVSVRVSVCLTDSHYPRLSNCWPVGETLSKPRGLGRRRAFNSISPYRLCWLNLCHVTWECVCCLRVCVTQHTIHLVFFQCLSAALLTIVSCYTTIQQDVGFFFAAFPVVRETDGWPLRLVTRRVNIKVCHADRPQLIFGQVTSEPRRPHNVP